MRLRIFALAFAAGFVFLFSVAAIAVWNFVPKEETEQQPETENEYENELAVFLLAFEENGSAGPFTLVGFDLKRGRAPVLTFPSETALNYSGVTLSAENLFVSVSREAFAGTVENELGIELSGYFVWNAEGCENIISAAGPFDFALGRDIKYKGNNGLVSLVSGVHSVTGAKALDILRFPNYTALGRCDMHSRLAAAFLNKRMKRLGSGSGGLYPTIFEKTETDVDAEAAAVFGDMAKTLSGLGKGVASGISADMDRDKKDNLLYFSDDTRAKIVKYFTKNS